MSRIVSIMHAADVGAQATPDHVPCVVSIGFDCGCVICWRGIWMMAPVGGAPSQPRPAFIPESASGVPAPPHVAAAIRAANLEGVGSYLDACNVSVTGEHGTYGPAA